MGIRIWGVTAALSSAWLPMGAIAASESAVGGPVASATAAPEIRPVPAVIDDYVREAMRSNLSLQSTTLDLERNLAMLDGARARFLPTLAFDARYTRSRGGRELDVPLGTVLNPVYTTLNQLLSASGHKGPFGPVQNQTILFQREREQDTRIEMRQPLYAPAIPAAVRAQRAQLESVEFSRLALARRLKRDVSVAYLDWLKTRRTIGIVDASIALLNENVRVSDSLYRNGRVTQDQVLRARAELLAVQQQLEDARNGEQQAHSYTNFLLNRSLDESLEMANIEAELATAAHDLRALRSAALLSRPELAQLDRTARSAESQIKVARAAREPALSLAFDAGIQDERYDFGRGRNFGMVSLVLSWQFFDGGATRAAERSARAEARRAMTLREETGQQIQLEVQQALDRLQTSADSLATAVARAEAARAAFRIASRKRDEGVINQVEFIDAQSTLTSAELNLNFTRFDVLQRQAELDYATAAGTMPFPIGSTEETHP